jgi:hypothetical protein
MNTASRLNTIAPMKYATLRQGEKHLCTVVLNELGKQKLFGFFGPESYVADYVRYYGHLTDQRLILEPLPYTDLENTIMGAVVAVGTAYSPGVAYSQGLQLSLAKKAMRDSDGKYAAFPLHKLDVSLIDFWLGKLANYLCFKFTGQEEMCFSVVPYSPNNFLSVNLNIKENLAFPKEFLAYIQEVIADCKLKHSNDQGIKELSI